MKCAPTGKDIPECRLHTVLLVRFSTQKPCVHLINVLLIKQFFYPKKRTVITTRMHLYILYQGIPSSLLSSKAQKVRSPLKHSPWNGPGTQQRYQKCTIASRFVSSSLKTHLMPAKKEIHVYTYLNAHGELFAASEYRTFQFFLNTPICCINNQK